MATSNSHSERTAYFSAMHRPSTPAVSQPKPLPPDVDAARKARINRDLVNHLKRPCPKNSTPSVQGIGLYTHVAGPPAKAPQFPHEKYTQKAPDPMFLPIGGPGKILKDRSTLETQTSEEMKRVWKEIYEAIHEEEKHVSHGGMNADQLKERYGALDALDADTDAQPMLHPQPQLQQMLSQLHDITMMGTQGGTVESGQQESGRRLSLGTGLTRDVVMGGTGQERRTSTSTMKTGNTYEAARDPRLRGRRKES
jgi:hypothetical protein